MADERPADVNAPRLEQMFPQNGDSGGRSPQGDQLQVFMTDATDADVRAIIGLCRAAGYDAVQASVPDLGSLLQGVTLQEGDVCHGSDRHSTAVADAAPQQPPDTSSDGRVLLVFPAAGTNAARQHLAERVEHIQQLKNLGMLAARVAHDFNNFLAAIDGQTELLRMQLAATHPARAHVDAIAHVSQGASELTRQLLAYAGKRGRPREALDLSEIVRGMARLLEVVIGSRCRLTYACTPGLPRIVADIGQLRHVVLNLLVNAVEAVGDRPGKIHVRTGWRTCDAAYLGRTKTPETPAPGQYVWLEVADTGCGMSPEIEAHIFEPFFSTKPTGTGLGLGSVLEIMQRHGGAVLATSAVGAGTTFTMLFPTAAAP